MAAIIASGTTETASSDIVVAAGTPTTLHVNTASGALLTGSDKALVQIKSAGSQYTTIAELTRSQPAVVVDGPGTYRVLRLAATVAFAVDQD